MLPITLDVSRLSIIIMGNGSSAVRRLKTIDDAGSEHIRIFSENPSSDLVEKSGNRMINRLPLDSDYKNTSIAFICGLDRTLSEKLALQAKAHGILVNVEDQKQISDFYMPAIVRRGDLLLTSSTNGASPRLAWLIKKKLEELFDERWEKYLQIISDKRKVWIQEGADYSELIEKTDKIAKGWVDDITK